MMKEDVLQIEYQKVFDKYAVKIAYQNDNVIRRYYFSDCGVKSVSNIEYRDDIFYIRGTDKDKDNKFILVSESELDDIIKKVANVNEKYGKTVRWRAGKREYYYHIGSEFYVYKTLECYTEDDNKRYEFGNYFKTEKDARRVLDSMQWKELWNDVKENKLKFGV